MPKLQQACAENVPIEQQRKEKAVCQYDCLHDSGQRYRMYFTEVNCVTDARCLHVILHGFTVSTSERRFHNNE